MTSEGATFAGGNMDEEGSQREAVKGSPHAGTQHERAQSTLDPAHGLSARPAAGSRAEALTRGLP